MKDRNFSTVKIGVVAVATRGWGQRSSPEQAAVLRGPGAPASQPERELPGT